MVSTIWSQLGRFLLYKFLQPCMAGLQGNLLDEVNAVIKRTDM